MKIRGPLIAAVPGLLLASSLAAPAYGQDQPWLADRRYTEGMGYRVGDFELHPGVALEFGYDSNFLLRASEGDAQGAPIGSFRLRVTPSFSFSTLGPQRMGATPNQAPPSIEFSGGISATYNEFIPLHGGNNDADKDALSDQRNIGGQLDLRLGILPRRPWSGVLWANVGRFLQPSQEQITGQGFRRVNPNAGAELVWNPNGGLLDWRLGYTLNSTIFEEERFSGLTNFHHTIQTRGRWRFLPRSALLFDARFGFIQYGSSSTKSDSHPLRVQLGYNGLITPNFGAMLMAGWGASFYSPIAGQTDATVPDFDSVIGQAELRYFFTPNTSVAPEATSSSLSALALGFQRDFYDAYIGTYFERDRGYLKLSYLFGGKMVVIVDAGVGALVNPSIPVLHPAPWTDIRVDASGFAEYRFKDAFGINTTIRYGTRISDESLAIPDTPGAQDRLQWQQFEAYLGARWLM
ncbi:hypothetical protein [Polyangium aurulentum]|uniref:hypothetical protein n=1 Tax=Polyangium aurulentum TaxID=2567896 RepID=UPI0010AE6C9C|nr:hypothetical protein [Polyangium aurulentum]UQA58257.1 hypothetical protein E8A73_044590 [Polyangium aurulentum]